MLVEEVRQGKEKRLKDLVMVSLTSAPPHSTALVFRDQKSEIEAISYGKLLSASCALEEELRAIGVDDKEVLCIHLDQDSPEILNYIVVLITALRIDCPIHFLERFSLVGMEEVGSRILLSSFKPRALEHASGSSTSPLASIPLLLSLLPRPKKSLNLQGVVYLVHTSGTTGIKKLVLATESSVLPNVHDFLSIFKPLPTDTVFMCSPPTFDPHVVDVFVALCSGASLMLIPRGLKSKGGLYRLLFSGERRVSILQTTPSLLDRIMEDHPVPSSLRVVAVGGETTKASTSAILARLWEAGCRIFHLYGLTEMSVWQSAVVLDTPSLLSRPPILVANVKQLLSETLVRLDDQCELIVSSSSRRCLVEGLEVAEYKTGDLGHWEGDLLFCDGRTDDIVKVLGKKVSLARVEAVLTNALSTKVVCTTEDSFLVAVVEDNKDHEMAALEVIKAAREHLETHELPSRIRMVAEVPVNVHGKVDRRRLGEEVSRSKETLEQWLHQAWAILTGTGPCLSDNFIENGGDSFSALLLVNQLESRMGELPSQALDIILNRQFRHVLEIVKGCDVGRGKGIKREREPEVDEVLVHAPPNPHPGVIWKLRGRSSSSSYKVKTLNGWQGDCQVTMERAWKCNLHSCVDSSPLYLKVDERELVAIGSHSGEVVLLELDTGLEAWRIDLTDRVEASPVVSWCGKCLLVASYNHKIYSLSITDGAVVWQFSTGGMVKCSPLVTRQGVFVGSYDRRLYRLSHSGKEVWSVQVSQGSILASPLVLPSGHLAVATLDGVVAAIGVKDGALQWRCDLGKPIFGSPLLLQGNSGLLLVPSTEGSLICIDENGKEKWRITTPGPVFSSPVHHEDLDSASKVQEGTGSALVGDHGGSVTCVTSSGSLLWRTVVGAAVAGAPDVQGLGVAVCTTQGEVVLLNKDKGEEMGRFTLSGEVFSSPLLLGNKLVVGCRDDFLYCLNIVPKKTDLPIDISSDCEQLEIADRELRRRRSSSPDPYSPATELAQLL